LRPSSATGRKLTNGRNQVCGSRYPGRGVSQSFQSGNHDETSRSLAVGAYSGTKIRNTLILRGISCRRNPWSASLAPQGPCHRPSPRRTSNRPCQSIRRMPHTWRRSRFSARPLEPTLLQKDAAQGLAATLGPAGYLVMYYFLRLVLRRGAFASNSAIKFPSGSAPMNARPMSGTSLLPTSSLPPAFLKASMCWSIFFTPM